MRGRGVKRFAQLIADSQASAAASPTDVVASALLGTPLPQPVATPGRIVLYHSKKGDGISSPAIVLRTRATTNPEIIERWGDKPDGTLSGTPRPAELVAELPDDETIDLLVHGLGGDYREYAVPFAFPTPNVTEPAPGTWSWPPRGCVQVRPQDDRPVKAADGAAFLRGHHADDHA